MTGKLWKTIGALAIGAMALSACSSQDDSIKSGPEWKPGQLPKAKVAWKVSTHPLTQPVIVGDVALLYTSSGASVSLTAVKTADGKPAWSKPASLGADSPVVQASRPVVVGSGAQTVVAYIASSGKMTLADPKTGAVKGVERRAGQSTTRPRACFDDPSSVCWGENGKPAVWKPGSSAPSFQPGGPGDFQAGGGQAWGDGLATDVTGRVGRTNRGTWTWQVKPSMKKAFGKGIPAAVDVSVAHSDGIYITTAIANPSPKFTNVSQLTSMIGLDDSGGKVKWRHPGGLYLCGGVLSRPASGSAASDGVSLPVACDVSGPPQDNARKNVALYGFNPAGGGVTWAGKKKLNLGDNVVTFGQPGAGTIGGAYAGTTEVVLRPADPLVVNLANGAQRKPAPGEVFLCRQQATVGRVAGDYLLTPCTAPSSPGGAATVLPDAIPQRTADQGQKAGEVQIFAEKGGLVGYKAAGW